MLNQAPCHEVWGTENIAPCIYLGTRWSEVVSFTPRPLYLRGKGPWYPLVRRLSGAQNRSGRGDVDKNPCPYRKSNSCRPARSLASILTKLFRLLGKLYIYVKESKIIHFLFGTVLAINLF